MTPCRFYDDGLCRSCTMIDLPYDKQIELKATNVRALLAEFGPEETLSPYTGPLSGFRNKAKMAVLPSDEGLTLGIVGRDGGAVGLCGCPLYPEAMRHHLTTIEAWLRTTGIDPYDVRQRRGEIKYVLFSHARATDSDMVRFVLRSEEALPRLRARLPDLLAALPRVRVVSVNIQPVHMAILEGDKEIFLSAETMLRENFNGIPLAIRPKSFFQTNPDVASALYAQAAAWCEEIAPKRIWDLFCGVGGFGLHCADPDRELTGIEIEPEAIEAARTSANELGLTQVTFAALDAALFEGTATPDLIIVNPPRRGLGTTLCATLRRVAAPSMIYSSCNPESLARDIASLGEYDVKKVRLFDMFPHTGHAEVLVLLARKGAA